MKFVQRVLGRSRIRAARQELAKNPSPMLYAQLARECAAAGQVREARRVCEEGLKGFPGSSELRRMAQRATRLEREARLRELKEELQEAPRPALWREMCDVLLSTGQITEAEKYALAWYERTSDPEARFVHARTLVERFLSDRSREAGRRAFEVLDEIQGDLAREPRLWELRLDLASRIGCWREARRCAAQLLGLQPGVPALEARFRSLDSMADNSPTIEQALLKVETTGAFANEGGAQPRKEAADVRPILRGLAAEKDVNAAFYIRGGTALVQGIKGATAERAARSVRTVLDTSRAAARRIGLGQVDQVQLEGPFGTLTLAPGEMDAGALWCTGSPSRDNERKLMDVAGLDAATEGLA